MPDLRQTSRQPARNLLRQRMQAAWDGLRVLRTIITERFPRAAGQPGSAGVGLEHIEPAEV